MNRRPKRRVAPSRFANLEARIAHLESLLNERGCYECRRMENELQHRGFDETAKLRAIEAITGGAEPQSWPVCSRCGQKVQGGPIPVRSYDGYAMAGYDLGNLTEPKDDDDEVVDGLPWDTTGEEDQDHEEDNW